MRKDLKNLTKLKPAFSDSSDLSLTSVQPHHQSVRPHGCRGIDEGRPPRGNERRSQRHEHQHTNHDAERHRIERRHSVQDVAVLIDREQGAPEQLATAGYTLHAALRLGQLLDYWRGTGAIDEATFERVRAYQDANQAK